MSRGKGMVWISRVAAGLAVAGFAVIGLRYAVMLPMWVSYAHAMAVAGTVCIGVVLCHPYLEVRGPGFALSDKAGDSPWWSNALMIFAVVVVVVVVATTRKNDVRALTGIFSFFACFIGLWCSAAANAKPGAAAPDPGTTVESVSGQLDA
ncbi:hypothetical protein ACFQZ4_03000 [Catellatospora coxensis]|uniref:Uncharacterized protein n=1 Tax=Catellatospora coxensis TaxID=310354 RepID=A0A8J3KTJ4_9ACTN|nr:hypothetical protein [Catellatospora coxensis]GIG04814.1 hypothetical protein Cco03nite_15140 [Catellatospora coxensis]